MKMMTEQEFSQLLDKLYVLGLEEGDVGYLYWDRVIQELREMRKVVVENAPKPPPNQRNANECSVGTMPSETPD